MTKQHLQFRHPATLVWVFVCVLIVASPAKPRAIAAPRTLNSVTTLAVTTTESRVDGSTESFSALAANPGGDHVISLQEAIKAANNTAAGSTLTIEFNLPLPTPLTSAITLTLTQPLPTLSRGNIRIDGTTQPQNIGVVLDGGASSRTSSGLLTIASSNNEVRGLLIRRFYNDAIIIQNNAQANLIADCTLELNGHNGMTLNGAGVSGNTVVGSSFAHNSASGIEIASGATNNAIGGSDPATSNTIGQNAAFGILVRGTATKDNLLGANIIVDNASGIALFENSEHTTVARNVISRNKQYGIWLDTSTTNVVEGNVIGLAGDGIAPQPNGFAGVLLSTKATNNLVGGSEGGRNLIGANGKEGIILFDRENKITYNYIGIGGDGETPVGNQSYGIRASSAAAANQIESNVISANRADGVRLDSADNLVVSNRIGESATGAPLPNAPPNGSAHGITVRGADNVIGPGNIVANHTSSGILVSGSGVQVLQNTIETNRRGICIAGDDAQISENTIQFNGIDGTGNECDQAGGGVLAEGDRSVVSENVIQANIGSGVLVLAGVGNRVQENSISNNTEEGITLSPGANGELAAPSVSQISATQIAGQGCSRCHIELFADDGDEGRSLIGTTTTDDKGQFALATTRAMLTGTFVTATATDGNNNTSAFGTPFRVPPTASARYRDTFVPMTLTNKTKSFT